LEVTNFISIVSASELFFLFWRGPCSETPTSGVQSKRLLTPIGLLRDLGSFTTSGAAGALRINEPSRPFGHFQNLVAERILTDRDAVTYLE
jgi:hypothetical protein